MTEKCQDLPASAVNALVLTFNLVGYELKSGPSRIASALEDSKVQEAIREALNKELQTFLKETQQLPGSFTGGSQAARKIGLAVGKAALDPGTQKIVGDIKRSSRYKKLERGLRDLKCSFSKSPVGVWVDENKALLIVIASGLVIGGGAAMYVARAGDVPADLAASLAQKKLKTIQLGKISVGASKITFVPSKRELGLQAFVDTSKWKAVRFHKFTINVHAKDDKLTNLGVGAEVRVPIEGTGTHQFMSGYVDPVADKYQFMLGIRHSSKGLSVQLAADYLKEQEKTSYGVAGKVGYKGNVGKVPLTISGSGGARRINEPLPAPATGRQSRSEYKFMLNLSANFDFL